jgi:hypothetical protein
MGDGPPEATTKVTKKRNWCVVMISVLMAATVTVVQSSNATFATTCCSESCLATCEPGADPFTVGAKTVVQSSIATFATCLKISAF